MGEDSRKIRSAANALRTATLSVNTAASLDISFLAHGDDLVAVQLIPDTPDTVEIQGVIGNDFVNIGAGITLGIDFKSSEVPNVRSTGGTVNLNVLAHIYVK